MPTLPNAESLRCFLAAAELRTFRAAARKVALSPAAFSERIRNLEHQLGQPLFLRTTRTVELTDAGRALVPAAQDALDALARCLHAVTPGAQAIAYELVLGTRYELGLSWLLPALPHLEALHPERTLSLTFGSSKDLLRALTLGETDAAITSARFNRPDLDTAPLHEEHYRLVTTPNAATPPERLDLAPELPLWRYLIDRAPHAARTPVARTRYLGTLGAVRDRLLSHGGIAVLPAYFVQDDLAEGRLIQPDATLQLASDHFRLVWRKGHHRAPQLRTLAEELSQLPLR